MAGCYGSGPRIRSVLSGPQLEWTSVGLDEQAEYDELDRGTIRRKCHPVDT